MDPFGPIGPMGPIRPIWVHWAHESIGPMWTQYGNHMVPIITPMAMQLLETYPRPGLFWALRFLAHFGSGVVFTIVYTFSPLKTLRKTDLQAQTHLDCKFWVCLCFMHARENFRALKFLK